MKKINKNWPGKNCSNCQYWTGQRILKAGFSEMEVDDSNKNLCMKFTGRMMNYNDSCGYWEKWSAI